MGSSGIAALEVEKQVLAKKFEDVKAGRVAAEASARKVKEAVAAFAAHLRAAERAFEARLLLRRPSAGWPSAAAQQAEGMHWCISWRTQAFVASRVVHWPLTSDTAGACVSTANRGGGCGWRMTLCAGHKGQCCALSGQGPGGRVGRRALPNALPENW